MFRTVKLVVEVVTLVTTLVIAVDQLKKAWSSLKRSDAEKNKNSGNETAPA